jgi:hypothetical protein
MKQNNFDETGHRRADRTEHLQVYGDEQVSVYDFSEGGIGLYTEKQYPVNFGYSLKIAVGDIQLNVMGSVAHCTIFGKLYRTGLKFITLKEDTKNQLREMSNRYSRGVPVKVELCPVKG